MSENKPKRYPTQLVLTIRVIVGGYVLYLMYGVLTSGDEKSIWMYLVVALLSLIGGYFAVWSLKMLIMGQYEGGKRDPYKNIEEDSQEDTTSQDETMDQPSAIDTNEDNTNTSAAESNKEIEIESVNDIAEVVE